MKPTERRMARLRAPSVPLSMLPVRDSTALADVGFEPVGEVMGAIVTPVRNGGFYAPPSNDGPPRTYTSSGHSLAVGTPSHLTATRAGTRKAMERVTAEAVARGADGVVGLTLRRDLVEYNDIEHWQFVALGTAVRSTGRRHTVTPFTTDLSGAQTAAALRSGWLPVAYLSVPCMAIRRVDAYSRNQETAITVNSEVDAYTDVIITCRRQARTDFAKAARQVHADGAVVSDMTLDFTPHPQWCTAYATITGTALARMNIRSEQPSPLTIVPVAARR